MGQFLGHLGGGLMILFVLLLALRCARQLGILFWASAPVRSSVPCWKPSPQAMAAAAAGVLLLQFLFAFVCWLDLGQSGGLSAFWQRFMDRFTTAGDAVHYLTLARQGYLAEGETAKCIVFYPLYPLAVRLFHTLLSPFSVSWEGAALAVSWICWGGAGAAMLVLAGQDLKREQAIAAAALMALYPFSFFALGVYTEGLFLLLSVGCLYALERRWWGLAGLAGLLAALCRTQGLALVFAAGYAVLAAGWRPRKGGGAALWAVAGPAAGYGGYLALNWAVHGDAFRYLYYQSIEPWYQHAAWFGDNLAQQYGMAVEYPGLARYIYIPQLVVYFVAVAALGYLYWRGVCHTAAVYSTAYFGMSYLSSWLISGGRYMFGCIGIFLALGALPKAPRRLLLAAEAGLLLLYAVYYRQGQAIM